MIIKTDKTNILLDNESILRLTGIKTDKYVLVDTQLSTFMIEDLNEYIVSTKWEEEEFDGRKLRKIKKEIIYEFGERKLKEYKDRMEVSTNSKRNLSMCQKSLIS